MPFVAKEFSCQLTNLDHRSKRDARSQPAAAASAAVTYLTRKKHGKRDESAHARSSLTCDMLIHALYCKVHDLSATNSSESDIHQRCWPPMRQIAQCLNVYRCVSSYLTPRSSRVKQVHILGAIARLVQRAPASLLPRFPSRHTLRH